MVGVFLLAGCGSAGGASRAPTTGPAAPATSAAGPRWPCLAKFGARQASTSDGVPIAVVGRGRAVVVLSNQSDQDACGWAGFVPALLRGHHAVVLYDYASDPVSNLESVVRFVRSTGTRTVALAGASEGAKTSIIAAVKVRPDAVVSLSAEAELGSRPVAPYAARLRAPTLFASADDDPYGALSATRGFFRSAPAHGKRLVTVPGSAHGTALLAMPTVRKAVLDFLAAHHA
jgi:hypothetical protein